MTYHYGRFREIDPDSGSASGSVASGDQTIASAILAARRPRVACIHCGVGVAIISVFCSTECRSECLASCGAGSTVGT